MVLHAGGCLRKTASGFLFAPIRGAALLPTTLAFPFKHTAITHSLLISRRTSRAVFLKQLPMMTGSVVGKRRRPQGVAQRKGKEMANPSTRKPLFEGVKNMLASMGGAKPAFAGAAAGAPAGSGCRADEGAQASGARRSMMAMAPCGKPAAAVAGASAGAVAAPAPGVKRDSTLEVMVASMVGTAIEFYDNYCYSIAAASYFGLIFFTDVAKSDPVLATLLAFVTFAVSFLARPFGSLLFGHFGDRLGRKKTLVAALMLMGTATFCVGLLPGYDVLGPVAVVLLCVCRACQGLGLAGEWSGAALVATENAPTNKRALFGSFPNLGAPIGFFCAYGVNLLLDTMLPADAMVAWGWRIPFLLSCLLVIVGLVVRLRMSETPVYQKAAAEQRTTKTPLRDLCHHWRRVVLGTCTMSITYTLFYVLGTWSLSYGTSTLGFTQQQYLGMQMVSAVFFAGFILVGCLTADKRGRKPVLLGGNACTLVFSFVAPLLLGGHNVAAIMVFLCVGFACMGTIFGPCGSYLPELFPAKVRYSGAGLSYNLAAITGGAFAPTIASALVMTFGIQALGWYMGGMAAVALVALLFFRESKDVDFEQ